MVKSRVKPTYNRRELEAIEAVCNERIEDGIRQAQWLMVIAFNDVLGIGAQRMGRVFERYAELTEAYAGYKQDGVEREVLQRRVEQILGEGAVGHS